MNALSTKIKELRIEAKLTQDQLANKLGVSHQAISQWENGTTLPDITMLTDIADIFEVSLDTLFDHKAKDSKQPVCASPFPDDNTVRAVIFLGNKYVESKELKNSLLSNKDTIVFKYEGEALDVVCDYSLECANIGGSVKAGHSVTVSGNVGGGVTCGHSLTCGAVSGSATAGHSLSVKGDINGAASAGHSLACKDIHGDVRAKSVSCKCIYNNGK